MKKTKIIWLLIFAWIASSVTAYLLINKHIEEKDNRLRDEIRERIEEIFENQSDGSSFITFDYGFFDSPMNGGRVKNYKKTQIPPKPSKAEYEKSKYRFLMNYDDFLEKWKENYGDLSSLWDLNWGSKDYMEREDGGWHIVGIRCHGTDDSFIHTFVIFPYRVGLKKTEWGNYYTVPDAVAEAFKFYTTNPKSGFSDRYEKGSNNKIWSKIYDSQNEYYGIYKNKNDHSWYSGETIPQGESPESGGPVQNGWMHNGFYRVYIAASQETHHGIMKHPWNPDIKERNALYLWWIIGLTTIFWTPIVILLIKTRREQKKRNESLKERLLRKCSPSVFMKNYNKEKVAIANDLYKSIVSTDDYLTLIKLAYRAQKELSINMIEDQEMNDLKALCNPTKYMKPYDAEKVSLANELFAILSKSDLSYLDFIDVQKRSKDLQSTDYFN